MARSTLCGYEYTDFQYELVRTEVRHPHTVRREPNITYRDEYALAELMDISQVHYEQFIRDWSRSYYDLESHMKAIHQYGHKDIPISSIKQSLYRDCVQEIQNRLSSLPHARAFDVTTELDQVPFKSSSAAGYDYVGEKGAMYGENHTRAIRRAKAVLWSVTRPDGQGIKHAIDTAVPDVGYTRTQLTDLTEKTKVRGVWGRAFHYILLEGTSAAPLLEVFKKNESFYHIGPDPTISVPQLLSQLGANCKHKYALDWKQFDATVSRFEINAAFDIIKSLIDFPNVETEDAFEICRQLFIHKKIAAPDGYTYVSHKGIPSGSYYTSIIGSIVNRLRIEYLWNLITGHSPMLCWTQGDDSLLGDDLFISPDELGAIANSIGWFFNPDKTEHSTIAEFVTFLGRTARGGMNERDLKRCLRLLILPEYPVESGKISAYRAKSIYEDGGRISHILNDIARRLRRSYGMASEEEVPFYFKRYIPGM